MNLLSEKYSKYLEVLGNGERIAILELLAGKTMCVQEINSHFHASQATISYHLSLLKDVGFITCDKVGKFIYYSVSSSVVKGYLKDFVRDFSLCLNR